MKGVFGVFIYKVFVIMHYQNTFQQYGVDYYHLSGYVDADNLSITPTASHLYGYQESVAIISDGVYIHSDIETGNKITLGDGDYGQALDFTVGEGERGTAIAGIIGGYHTSSSIGLVPSVAKIYDYPIFRRSIYDSINGTDAEKVNTIMASPDYLIKAINDASAKGVGVIIIDINYLIFSLTFDAFNGANDFQELENAIINASQTVSIVLGVGDVDIKDDETAVGAQGNPYFLLDSLIPRIRPFIYIVAGSYVTWPLYRSSRFFSDLFGGAQRAAGGYGNERMLHSGYVGPIGLDRYTTDNTIIEADVFGNESAMAFFGGFLALIRAMARVHVNGEVTVVQQHARAALYYFPTEINPSSDRCGVYTGNGNQEYVEEQIYPRGWNSFTGFGTPSFEILQRIASNTLRGCAFYGQTVTKLTPDPDELLPARFQSSIGTTVNTFSLLNQQQNAGWPDLGPPPFHPPTDVDFVERNCPP